MKNKGYLLRTVLLALLVFTPHTLAQDYTTWDLPEGAIARLGKGVFRDVAYSPDGTRLAVSSSIGVWIYDIESGKALNLFPLYRVSCMAFSPNGKFLVSGSKERLFLWDIATGEPLRTFENEYWRGAESVAFSPDGKTIASGHSAGHLRLWETETGKLVSLLSGMKGGEEGSSLPFEHDGPVYGVAFSPDGKTLVSVGYAYMGTEIRLWETATGEHIRLLDSYGAEENSLDSIAFSPDGKTLAVGLGAGGITLWDTKANEHPQYLEAPNGRYMRRVSSLAFSPEGAMLASYSEDREDKIVDLWDIKTNKHLQTFIRHKDRAFSVGSVSVAFSPDGKTFASSSEEAVYLWNIHGEKQSHSVIMSNAIWNIAFRPDGQLLTNQKKINTDLPSDTTIDKTLINRIKQEGRLSCRAFCPNTQRLAIGIRSKIPPSGKRDDAVLLWDTTTGEHIRTLTGHLDTITCVAFSTDGQQLASGSDDETILLWDLKNSKYPRILIGHNDKVLDVAFSPDGKTLASRSTDGIVLLWDLANKTE